MWPVAMYTGKYSLQVTCWLASSFKRSLINSDFQYRVKGGGCYFALCNIVCSSGTAYIHGMQHASGNFIIIMDADLSHHVSVFILNMVESKATNSCLIDHIGYDIKSGDFCEVPLTKCLKCSSVRNSRLQYIAL